MIVVWYVCVFVLGAMAGSFLNVCIHRLPYEKSVLWPLGSRCGNCFQPVHWYDNLPLVSYWLLRGRCRVCGAKFTARYFLVELVMALGLVGVFHLEVMLNVHDLSVFKGQGRWMIQRGLPPTQVIPIMLSHGLLLFFLLGASFVDLEHFEIPLPMMITGSLVGLVLATIWPWPWPNLPANPAPVNQIGGFAAMGVNPPLRMGLLLWPVWDPLPAWLPPGAWQTGLVTSLAGLLAGVLMLRGIRFLFGLGRGKEGLGIGDADLMMMAGTFLGWQAVCVAFLVSVLPALLIGIGQVILRGNQEMPFGPSLAFGVLLTLFGWQWIGPHVQFFFFNLPMLGLLFGGGAVVLVIASFMLRLLRGTS